MRARLGLCLLLVVAAAGVSHGAQLSPAQAERELAVAEGLPSRENWQGESLRHRLQPLEAVFRRAATRHPARAYQGLGRCQMLRGRYREAGRWFQRAVKAKPRDCALAANLRRAQQFAAIAAAAGRQLPEGTVVLQVEPLRGDARGVWAVLSAAIGPAQAFTNDNFYEGARLRLLHETPRGPRLFWRSDVLRVRNGPDEWTNGLRMYVLDEKPLKVLVEEVCYMADSSPSHVDVFAWQKGKLVAVPVRGGETDIGVAPSGSTFPSVQVCALDGDIAPWVLDLGHNGQHEVVTLNRIGSGLSMAAMPFWPSIYAYERGAYVLADQRFPKAYRETGKEIQERLRERPDNYELLKYLGIYYEIEGDRKAARDAYQRAEACLSSQGTGSASAESELADIQARIQRLGG